MKTIEIIVTGLYFTALFTILFKLVLLLSKVIRMKKELKAKETMECGNCGDDCELLTDVREDGHINKWCYCEKCRINTFHPSMKNYPKITGNSIEQLN